MRRPALLAAFVLLCAHPAWPQVELLTTWEGSQAGEQYGIALALGGDFNHDGRADLAVGASTNDAGGENAGRVAVYFGRSEPVGDRTWSSWESPAVSSAPPSVGRAT